jgi:chromosome segregation ATPase
MSSNPFDNERLDNDQTDELPILLDTAVLDPDEQRVATVVSVPGDDDTGQYPTVRFAALTTAADESAVANIEALRAHLAERDEKIAALENDIGRLSSRWLDVERHLSDRDASIAEFEAVVAELRAALAERSATELRLTTEIADRDTQFNKLLDDLDRLRREAAAAEAAIAESRSAAQSARAEVAALQAAAAALPDLQTDSDELAELREQHAALAHSIGNRQALWQELENRAAASVRRVAELEAELAQRSARQREAEAVGRAESERANRLRNQLVDRSRRAEALERDLRALRNSDARRAEPSAELRSQLATAQGEAATLELRLAAATEQLALERIGRARDAQDHAAAMAALAAQPQSTPSVGASEVSAQLEAELEHQRAQLAAVRAQLQDRAKQLSAAADDLEQQRRQLVETRTQLEQKRSDAARLERALIEKDRALEARDERIATLQSELDERMVALQRLNAMDASLQGLDTKMSDRLKRAEAPAATEGNPSLVCLTSDQPRRYPIIKKTMTIGRSSECDIQILTHFVSREHARLTIGREGVMIEDLGSTNGVFVNSVRVDRHELRHSDLVTVGETQFRFLETMAH